MATLDEISDADFICHVVDISEPKHQILIQTSEKQLHDLKTDHIPKLYVFNKVDKINNPEIKKN